MSVYLMNLVNIDIGLNRIPYRTKEENQEFEDGGSEDDHEMQS